MGYKLRPSNKELEPFEFGAFSFPVLLDACGYLFPCIHNGPQWYCDFAADHSLIGTHPDGSGSTYPTILGGGYYVTREEAIIMSKIARNFVSIQRSLPEENRVGGFVGQVQFKREDIEKILVEAMNPSPRPKPWPPKVRDDFTDKIEKFIDWAVQSHGFTIEFTMMVNGVNVDQRSLVEP